MGFFDDDEISATVKGCGDCPIQHKVHCKDFCGLINPRARILIVDEHPWSSQIEADDWDVGSHASWLLKTLRECGINQGNASFVHAKRCCHSDYSEQCVSRLINDIVTLKPRVVMLCGDQSIQAIIGKKFPSLCATSIVQGYVIPEQEYKCFVVPNYGSKHFDIIGRNPAIDTLFRKNVNRCLEYSRREFTPYTPIDCRVVSSIDDVSRYLARARKEIVAIDFETTGLKPHRKGHKVLTVGLGFADVAVAFVVTDDNKAMIADYLACSSPKLIYNLSFECLWAKVFFGVTINNIVADVMLQAHLLDGKTGILSLDKQVYLHFGIASWDAFGREKASCEQGHGANSFNRLEAVVKHGDVHSLLKYNAMDCAATMMLYQKFIGLGL